MNFDLTIITSLFALGISIFSLLIALYNSHVGRQIQLEQLKGEIRTRLIYRAIEILTHIEKLGMKPSFETVGLQADLIKVAEGIVAIRQSLQEFPKLPLITSSFIIPLMHKIRNDVNDAEPIFDNLNASMAKLDLKKIRLAIDGLLERIVGPDSSKPTLPNKANTADR